MRKGKEPTGPDQSDPTKAYLETTDLELDPTQAFLREECAKAVSAEFEEKLKLRREVEFLRRRLSHWYRTAWDPEWEEAAGAKGAAARKVGKALHAGDVVQRVIKYEGFPAVFKHGRRFLGRRLGFRTEDPMLLKGDPAWGVPNAIRRLTAPIEVEIDPRAPRRVNVVTATVNFKYFFGGYFAVFSLAMWIRRQGFEVRVVLSDETDFDLADWRKQIKRYHGLENFFDLIDVAYVYDRNRKLLVNPADTFVSTSWWTSHAVKGAAEALGLERWVYLSQEIEPIFYGEGALTQLSRESYDFPTRQLFSSELLRQYHRLKRLGAFKEDAAIGDQNTASFQNAITAETPSMEKLNSREGPRKLLFYARPEQHAERNGFPIGLFALEKLVQEGLFKVGEWEIHGMGATTIHGHVRIADGQFIRLLPKMGLNEYNALLQEYDLGLALMYSPHPSLVPLDFAAAGMVVVTNTFENKTAEAMSAISTNIIAKPPSIDGVADGLREALERIDDVEARLLGARLNWARDWDAAFDGETGEKLRAWLSP